MFVQKPNPVMHKKKIKGDGKQTVRYPECMKQILYDCVDRPIKFLTKWKLYANYESNLIMKRAIH